MRGLGICCGCWWALLWHGGTWRWCLRVGATPVQCLLPTAQTCTASHVLASIVNSMDANAGDCSDADWDVPNTCTLSCSPGYTPSTNPLTCTATDTYTAVTCQGTRPPLNSTLHRAEGIPQMHMAPYGVHSAPYGARTHLISVWPKTSLLVATWVCSEWDPHVGIAYCTSLWQLQTCFLPFGFLACITVPALGVRTCVL